MKVANCPAGALVGAADGDAGDEALDCIGAGSTASVVEAQDVSKIAPQQANAPALNSFVARLITEP
ncbi:MAG: hypothetical protein V9E85_12680 [Candidatus Nanopelagicales bacterium]|jgi:hypothetical protein